ncbi:MAG: hypothetical protein Q9162_006470, partial [Coniocarpon cinnabarinum]
EVAGYIGRTINAYETPDWTLGPYIVQSLCLLLPPAFFAASIYMSLGRLVRATGSEQLVLVKPGWLTKIFVGGDVLSFLMQASGGGIQAQKTQESFDTGSHIILGGLILQLLYFGFFIFMIAVFQWRLRAAHVSTQRLFIVSWKKSVGVLYITSFLILIRSIYRTVEYAQGQDGDLMAHEAYFFGFDSCLMLLVVVLYGIFPSRELSQQVHERGGSVQEGYEVGSSSRSSVKE